MYIEEQATRRQEAGCMPPNYRCSRVVARSGIGSRWVPTKAYVARKTAQGHSNLEIICCITRYLAREIYYLLRQPTTLPKPLDS